MRPERLLAVDPLGRNNLKLLANSFQLAADTNHWLDVVTTLQAMTTEVTVTSFAPGKDGARFVGTALGSEEPERKRQGDSADAGHARVRFL